MGELRVWYIDDKTWSVRGEKIHSVDGQLAFTQDGCIGSFDGSVNRTIYHDQVAALVAFETRTLHELERCRRRLQFLLKGWGKYVRRA